MSFERAKKYLEEKGYADRITIPEHSSATVTAAAEAIGVEPDMIAKTLSFLQGDKAVLVLASGLAKVDNKKYRDQFGCKSKMIPADLVEELVGHDVGGVCPFGINPGIPVFLDVSLKKHDVVYPAAGSDHSAVRLTLKELEECSGCEGWVDVCKEPAQ